MSPKPQTLGTRALKTRKPNRRGLEMARKTARRASSESLISVEEIIASLNLLDEEMAERKPRRRSSERKFLKKRWAALKRLDRGKKYLKGRNRSEAEDTKKKTKAMEEEGEDIALKRAMNEEEKKEIRVFNEGLNLLATALLGDSRPEGGASSQSGFCSDGQSVP